MKNKMVMAILEDLDCPAVMRSLHAAGHPITLIDSSGGLLRRGSSTLIAGVAEGDVDTIIKVIDQQCRPCVNPFKKRATIMVFDVDLFEQIY